MTAETSDNKIQINTSRKGLKLRNQVTLLLTVIFLIGLLWPVKYYHDKKVAAKNEIKAVISKLKIEVEALKAESTKKPALSQGRDINIDPDMTAFRMSVSGSEIIIFNSNSDINQVTQKIARLEKKLVDGPEIDRDVLIVCIPFGIALFCLWMSYWSAARSTKNTLEYNFTTGRFRLVNYETFGISNESIEAFDLLTEITVGKNIYSEQTGVASLTIESQRIIAGCVSTTETSLDYCADYMDVLQKISEQLKARGLDAVKVQMVD